MPEDRFSWWVLNTDLWMLSSIMDEEVARDLAEMNPQHIYFFADLAPVDPPEFVTQHRIEILSKRFPLTFVLDGVIYEQLYDIDRNRRAFIEVREVSPTINIPKPK